MQLFLIHSFDLFNSANGFYFIIVAVLTSSIFDFDK